MGPPSNYIPVAAVINLQAAAARSKSRPRRRPLDLAQRDERGVTSGTCNSKADKTNSENLFAAAELLLGVEHKRLSLSGASGVNFKSKVACKGPQAFWSLMTFSSPYPSAHLT